MTKLSTPPPPRRYISPPDLTDTRNTLTGDRYAHVPPAELEQEEEEPAEVSRKPSKKKVHQPGGIPTSLK